MKSRGGWCLKVGEFQSIETSADESYSTISGVTIAGKPFTVKTVWWTDNKNDVLFSCHKWIKGYIDNQTPPEEYSPYILSGSAVEGDELILKQVDTCSPKAPNFGVPEENVY